MKAAIRHRLPLEVTVVSLMTAITLAVIALIAAHLLSYRHDLLDNAERGAANLASAFEEHLTVSVGLLDDTLLAARTQPAVRTSQGLRDALKVRPGLNDIALQVSVADRSGQMIASNFDMNGPISIADRPHFRHFSDGNSDDLFISEPVFGRVSQRWTIQVVRRLADASGHFDGVIVISLPPEYLIRFYNTIDVGPRGMVSVIGLDGIVRAQVVASDALFGQALTDSPLVAAARGEMAGSIRSPGPGDAVPRLISFKRVRGHPLFIAVGLAEQDVLSDFRAQLRLWLAIATGGLVSLGIAGTITLRQLRAQRTYEMEIARHRRELEQRVAQRTQRLTLEIERRRESEQALTESIEAMKQAQGEALRASRMASVGQLAAGIAHEINTPVQYIGDNLRFIGESLKDLLDGCNPPASDSAEAASGSKLAFLRTELPSAVAESLEGVTQIALIVQSMRDFSHAGGKAKTLVDLNAAIETTLTVTRNLWREIAETDIILAPDLPPVLCLPAEMNQVLLHLIVNAAQAIESSGKPLPGRIRIETWADDTSVSIRVSDTGNGVPDGIRDRIFDLFFTTRDVGKGAGQGLAICRDVVVTKHGGTLDVGGREGDGASFTLTLPIDGRPAP